MFAYFPSATLLCNAPSIFVFNSSASATVYLLAVEVTFIPFPCSTLTFEAFIFSFNLVSSIPSLYVTELIPSSVLGVVVNVIISPSFSTFVFEFLIALYTVFPVTKFVSLVVIDPVPSFSAHLFTVILSASTLAYSVAKFVVPVISFTFDSSNFILYVSL